VTFLSSIPGWTYITILAGLLVFAIVVLVIRKQVVATAWPLCEQCVRERRRNLLLMWVAALGWMPALVLVAVIDELVPGTPISSVLLLLVLVGSPVAAVVFGNRGSYQKMVGGTVSPDVAVVAFPAAALADEIRGAATAYSSSSILPV
jgi:hypothetical protein